MSTEDKYYGEKKGTTYLEVYSVNDKSNEHTTHRLLKDQDAYDTWHLSLYYKEIISYRKMLSSNSFTFEDLPRKEKNLLLYLLLASNPNYQSIVELGSSLFEMVDGLDLVRTYIKNKRSSIPDIDPSRFKYTGVEISKLLNDAARDLHKEYNMNFVESTEDAVGPFDILYDRSVTNYAFDSPKDVASFVNKSQCALLNIFLSKGETFISSRLGKRLTYFSLEEFVEELNHPLFHLFGNKAPGPVSGTELSKGRPVVEGFFLCASIETVESLMNLQRQDPQTRNYFQEKQIQPIYALELLEN
mgnify:CR=1 FL=1